LTKPLQHITGFSLLLIILLLAQPLYAQIDSSKRATDTLRRPGDSLQTDKNIPQGFITDDSLNRIKQPIVRNKSVVDSVFRNHDPKIATRRSALIPGWGQVYNKRIWKVPIIYGALITTGVIFFYNLNTYRELRFAYKARAEAEGFGGVAPDSTNYKTLQEIYKVLDINAIKTYRNEYRRNIDFSALAFLLFWGLNVVDATVDAHLRTFDVSPDLSLHIRAGYSDMSNTAGIRFILAFK
jgi:hypothetical protein